MQKRDHHNRMIRVATTTLLCICVLVFVGCETVTVSDSVTDTYAGNDPDAQLSFWHELNSRPVTSNDDAFHALLVLIDGQDDAGDYAGRLASLQERNLLSKGFNRPANEAVTRGTVAVVLVNALEIDGGLIMRMTGPNPRYAVRELVYMNIFPTSSPQQTFSGGEFVSVIGRVEDYQRRQAATASPAAQSTPATEG